MKPHKTIWRYLAVLGLVVASFLLYSAHLFAQNNRSQNQNLVKIGGRGPGIIQESDWEVAAEIAAVTGLNAVDRVDRADAVNASVQTDEQAQHAAAVASAPRPLDFSASESHDTAPPKIALLFLTRHSMKPLEGIWTDWLEASPINWQVMFDVHIHVSDPDSDQSMLQYPKNSVFHNAVLKEHVRVQWGNHSMITAERALFKQAMKNRLVQTFVLLSEDSAPLYPAILTYMQLILEPKSRVNACNDDSLGDLMSYRWVPRMAEAGLSQELWRKSSQWVALKRPLVEVVLNDKKLDRMFAEECYVCTDGSTCFPQRFCVSDEHYIPSLLALKGLEDDCACDGLAMMTRWENGAPHPKTFGMTEVEWADDWVIEEEMRDGWNENHDCGSLRSGRFDDWADGKPGNVLSVAEEEQAEALWKVLDWDEDKRNRLMHQGCPLFIRKISTNDEDAAAWRAALEKYIV